MTTTRLTRTHLHLLLAAAGFGCTGEVSTTPPVEEVQVVQQPFIDYGNNASRFPQEIKALGEFASKLSAYYSYAKTGLEIAQFLGVALGWMDAPPTQQELFMALENKLHAATRANAYEIRAQVNADRWASLKDALVLGKQALDLHNQGLGDKMERSWSGYINSADAVTALEYQPTWTRVHDFAHIDGTWSSIVGARPATTVGTDGNPRTYDWRLVVPLYLEFIAMRLQVIAAVDPNFRTLPETAGSNRTLYWTEFNGRIETLRAHYDKIKEGIKCGRAGAGGTDFKRACVDLATGIQAVYSGWENGDPGELKLRADVEKMTPLFQIKQMENLLSLYRDMNLLELGQKTPISPNAPIAERSPLVMRPANAATGPALCLRVSEGTPYLSFNCQRLISPSTADWTYDRQTGKLRNEYSGTCLYADIIYGSIFTQPINPPLRTRTTDCNSTAVAERGLWTYDAVTQRLMNNQHLMHLDVQTIFDEEEGENILVPMTSAYSSSRWISPEIPASYADEYGWAFSDDASPPLDQPYNPDPSYARTSGNDTISITRFATGQYRVDFPNIGSQGGGNVLVNGYGSNRRCNTDGWGSSGSALSVWVSCYQPQATAPYSVRADSQFVVNYQQRAGTTTTHSGAYVWSYRPSDSGDIGGYYSWNSSGGSIYQERWGTGGYVVYLGGLGNASHGGTVQVNRYWGDGTCKVGGWWPWGDDMIVYVNCYDGAGNAEDSYYTLSFSTMNPAGGGNAGFAWHHDPTAASYTPDAYYRRIQNSGMAVTDTITAHLMANSTGRYLVQYPQLLTGGFSTALVSAYGWGNEYCTIKDLVSYSGKVYIDCFTPSGDPINTTYVSAYLVGSNLN